MVYRLIFNIGYNYKNYFLIDYYNSFLVIYLSYSKLRLGYIFDLFII